MNRSGQMIAPFCGLPKLPALPPALQGSSPKLMSLAVPLLQASHVIPRLHFSFSKEKTLGQYDL